MTTQHTKTPWQVHDGFWIETEGYALQTKSIAKTEGTDSSVRQANAAFIVKACNAHDALVSALEKISSINYADESCESHEDLADYYGNRFDDIMGIASKALKLARGEA